MKFLSRVVWSEGMLLTPHHFQAQSRYFEDTLWFLSANLRQNPWGFHHFSVDEGALRNGQAILRSASGILPDGLIFDFPDCDQAPASIALKDIFRTEDNEITLHLAIRARDNQGDNYDRTGGARTRYGAISHILRDDVLGQDEYEVSFAHKNLLLVNQAELAPDMVSIAIARIQRDGKGGFASDPDFIAPCLRIGASGRLPMLLRHLLESIDEKIATVRRDRRSFGRMELGTGALDVANYWFLHCLSSASPALRQHLSSLLSHPEGVYRDLARLAGALSTFSLESTPEEIPKYTHEDLTSTFRELDVLIRHYLEVVLPSNFVKLDFHESGHAYIQNAIVSDERCLRRARWILGIRSPTSESMLLRLVPKLVKICSAEGAPKLVERALPGLELLHLPVPPSALAAQADMHYFSISLTGPCWEHILRTRQVGVYVPGEIGDVDFDITILTETPA
jgi:type VI secretion system protein ImpJ